MSPKRFYYLLMVILVISAAACSQSPSAGSGSGIPADKSSSQPIAKSQGEADFLDQNFVFSMEAYLTEFDMSTIAGAAGANLYPAIMRSTWAGDFTIDPDGHLNGNGKLITEATIFNVDQESWCGFAFTELADHDFVIKGQLRKEGEKYFIPIKIWEVKIINPNPPLGPPEPTCADPDPIFSDPTLALAMVGTHRTAMISIITQHLHQTIGNQIEMGVELKVEEGKVEYEIFISPEIVDLNE